MLPRVADKQLFDEVFSKLAGVLEEVVVKVIVERGDVVVGLLLTVAKERRGATQPAQNQRQNQPEGTFKSSADNASPKGQRKYILCDMILFSIYSDPENLSLIHI